MVFSGVELSFDLVCLTVGWGYNERVLRVCLEVRIGYYTYVTSSVAWIA